MNKLNISDPRSVARENPGLLDALFPQLTPGIVGLLNRSATPGNCSPISNEMIAGSKLQKAMLFELAYAASESLISEEHVDWDSCLNLAVERQRHHFDASIPDSITDSDKLAALSVAENLSRMILDISASASQPVVKQPLMPGYQWISTGRGDFSIGSTLIEVKCTGKNFSAADYRQILIYWLLSFANSLEKGGVEWQTGILLNPRSATLVLFEFKELLHVVCAGRSKIEVLLLFSSMVESTH